MNKNLIKFAAIFGLTAVVAHAQFASNIGVTSNYVWRGMTYSDDGPAAFGGLDFSSESGFYAGTWLSSMNAADDNADVDAESTGGNTEVDLYLGFSGETGSTEYDIGVIRYSYLDTADDDYYELYGSLTFSGLTLGGAYTIESQATDTAGGQETFIEGDVYLYASYSIDLAETIGEGYSLTGTVGQYLWDDDGVGGVDVDYNHLLLELSKDAGDFGTVTLSGSFVSSDFINTGFMDDDDPRFFVTWSKEF